MNRQNIYVGPQWEFELGVDLSKVYKFESENPFLYLVQLLESDEAKPSHPIFKGRSNRNLFQIFLHS